MYESKYVIDDGDDAGRWKSINILDEEKEKGSSESWSVYICMYLIDSTMKMDGEKKWYDI